MTDFIAIDAKSRDQGSRGRNGATTLVDDCGRFGSKISALGRTTLRLRTARFDCFWSQQAPNRLGKPFRLRTRMWSESSTMQAFLHGRSDKILPWQSEAVTHWLNGFLHHSAAHPKQSSKIETRSRRRDGIERV
jgi:hypothetical protein